MTEESLVPFAEFTDRETAEKYTAQLDVLSIAWKLTPSGDGMSVLLNIRKEDQLKAEPMLFNYYGEQIKQLDPDYYLFDFTNEELQAIIQNPFDWGWFDHFMAKHLLMQRGAAITEEQVNQVIEEKLAKLSAVKKEHALKIIAGYILAIAFPPVGIGIGLSIKYHRQVLPNGQEVYLNTEKCRIHGKYMINLSILACINHLLLILIWTATERI
jgi:hypothetical protein